jgi:predicted deacylase
MEQRLHELLSTVPGTRHHLTSLHFGRPGQGPKAYLQGGLHADEVPGLLAAHHLREALTRLDARGAVRGEVILVPMANPLGLNQWTLRGHQGRFESHTGENFNRHFADLVPAVLERVRGTLDGDAAANVARVRAAMRAACAELGAATALEDLRRTLLGLAIDADLMLDLHCDGDGLLHLYTTPGTWDRGERLARHLGAPLALLADVSGGEPFDEACSGPWTRLAEALGPSHPLPPACFAVTVELRGEADVDHALAWADACGVLRFLAGEGVIELPDDDPVARQAPPPPVVCQASPLAGSIPLVAPHGGIVVWRERPGARVLEGQPLVDVIEPDSGRTTTLGAGCEGLFFARDAHRWTRAGGTLGKVAGQEARRTGSLLGAR